MKEIAILVVVVEKGIGATPYLKSGLSLPFSYMNENRRMRIRRIERANRKMCVPKVSSPRSRYLEPLDKILINI